MPCSAYRSNWLICFATPSPGRGSLAPYVRLFVRKQVLVRHAPLSRVKPTTHWTIVWFMNSAPVISIASCNALKLNVCCVCSKMTIISIIHNRLVCIITRPSKHITDKKMLRAYWSIFLMACDSS